MQNFNPVRGTYDYLPKDAKIREAVRQIILKNYQSNGFNLISTPILENLQYLTSSDGGDNLKLMFKTVKRGDKLNLSKENLTLSDIVEEGLRYDLTVPLARFYANNRDVLPNPFKSIQIDCAFRAERPQRGRNRQFVQCDIDIIGDKTINAELELLCVAIETLSQLNFKNLTVKINHKQLLNAICLFAGFKEEEISTVCVTLDKLDKISLTGVTMELIEKGFETEIINRLIEVLNDINANGIEASLKYGVAPEIVNDLQFLISTLNQITGNKHMVKFDVSIVRGQGYYTGAVFEIYAPNFGGAISGGGRYDKMVGKITGNDAPAVGLSLGFEPITLILKEAGENLNMLPNLALIYDEQDDIKKVFEIKNELRKNYNVSIFARQKNMKNFYDKIGEVADYCTSVKDYLDNKPVKSLK